MIAALGRHVIWRVEAFGEFSLLVIGAANGFLKGILSRRFRRTVWIDQLYLVAIESLPVIVICLGFVSLMLILEFSFHMKLVLQQDSLVPAFSTVLLVRELGPVVTSLLIASRVGASYAAEIGTMKITEQLDALRLVGVDPVEYLVLPRWFAAVFGCVALSVIAVAVSIWMGGSVASLSSGKTPGEFFNTMFTFTRWRDLLSCLVKSSVFGSLLAFLSCFHGFRCAAGSGGVGNAATLAVVQSCIWIIVADFVLTYLLYTL